MLPGKLFLTISSGKCSKCLGLARTEMKCPPLRTWMRKTKTRSTTAVLKSGFSSNCHRYIKTSTTSIQILFVIIVFEVASFSREGLWMWSMTIHQDWCMRKLTQHHSKRIHLCCNVLNYPFLIFFPQTQNVFLSVADFPLPQLPTSLSKKLRYPGSWVESVVGCRG